MLSVSSEDLQKLHEFWLELSGGSSRITRSQFILGMSKLNPALGEVRAIVVARGEVVQW